MKSKAGNEVKKTQATDATTWATQIDPMLYGLLLAITRAIVDHPQELHVVMHGRRDQLDFNVLVPEGDLVGLVGAKGNNARAIRSVVSACGLKMERAVSVSFASIESPKTHAAAGLC